MKTVKVCWTEREIIEYSYEETILVEDNFVVNSENLIDEVSVKNNDFTFDSKSTNYEYIEKFIGDDGKLEIAEIQIDSYEEILPPSPEEKKAEYQQMLIDIQKREDAIKEEKESILKLLTS